MSEARYIPSEWVRAMHALSLGTLSYNASALVLQAFILLVASLVAIKLVWWYIEHRRIQSKMANIPIPPHRFPFQHLFQLLRRPPWDVLREWTSHYGPIVRFHFFDTFIVVSEPDVIKHILGTNFHNYRKDLEGTYSNFHPVLGTGLITSHGDLWRAQRSLVASAFRAEILGHAATISKAAADRLTAKLVAFKGKRELVEIGEEFRRLTLQVIGAAVLSLKPEESDEVFPKCYLPIVKEANKRVWYPYRKFLPFPGGFEMRRATRQLNAYITNLINARRTARMQRAEWRRAEEKISSDAAAIKDILDRIMDGVPEENWSHKTLIQLRDEIKTFIFAGHETSSMMLTWALYELTQHPECLAKVRAEADSVFKNGAMPDFEDLKGLTYTLNVLKETLRKYSIVPVVTRETASDEVVNGYFFPKGSKIAILIKGMHYNEDLWENPTKFDPDRFNQKLAHPYAFMPFIEGPRNCIGQHFSLLESKIVLALMVQRFTFTPAPKQGESHLFEIPICPRENMRMYIS